VTFPGIGLFSDLVIDTCNAIAEGRHFLTKSSQTVPII